MCHLGVIYAAAAGRDSTSKTDLQAAVELFLEANGALGSILWTLSYLTSGAPLDMRQDPVALTKIAEQVLSLNAGPHDIAFPDGVLKSVEEVSRLILGSDVRQDTFLRFEGRETDLDDA